MGARFIGMQPWQLGASIIACTDLTGTYRDLHNVYEFTSMEVRVTSSNSLALAVRFGRVGPKETEDVCLTFDALQTLRIETPADARRDMVQDFIELSYFEDAGTPAFELDFGALSVFLKCSTVRLDVSRG